MPTEAQAHDEFLQATMGCMDLVYNIARRMVSSMDDAQDLVQETYLSAFRAWVDGRRPERMEPWIATICLNLGRSRHRRQAHRPHEVPTDEMAFAIPDDADPEREALATLDAEVLHAAMAEIPEEQCVALTLVDLGGLSTTEAADVMRTPRGTVLSRLHRGRRALALLLADQMPGREVT